MTVNELMLTIFRDAKGPNIQGYEVQMPDCLPVAGITIDDDKRVVYISDAPKDNNAK